MQEHKICDCKKVWKVWRTGEHKYIDDTPIKWQIYKCPVCGFYSTKIQVTEEMRERARQKTTRSIEKHGYYNTWYPDEKNKFIGFLGEEVVSGYFKTPLENTDDYDIILNSERVDIKSQGINVHYVSKDFEVKSLKINGDCDRYMFLIVHNSFDYAWIVGHISEENFSSTCRRGRFNGTVKFYVLISELEKM